MNKLIWMGCLSYLLIGLAHVVVGPVLEPLIHHYGVDYKDGGQLIMNQFFGFLVGVLISPWLLRIWGRRLTILLALGCLTAAESVYSFLPPWGWMLTVGPLAGFGFGMVESVIGAMILAVIVEKKAAAMSRLEVFFGLGALAMPGVAAFLLRQGLWEYSFPFVALVSGITMLLWIVMSFGHTTDRLLRLDKQLVAAAEAETTGTREGGAVEAGAIPDETNRKGDSRTTPRRRMLPILAAGSLFFFLYVGTEMSFANYVPSILHLASGLSESTAAIAVSLFWGAMAAGRWMIAPIADGIRHTRFLLITCTGTAVGLMLIALAASVPLSFALIVVLGLIMAGMFTMGLIFINEALPGTTERTTSILVACGGLGGALLPKLTGWMMDRFAPVTSLWLMAGFALAMLLVIGVAIRLASMPKPVVPVQENNSHIAAPE
jgi:FHS family glucose/mannose:H+ symporter-like MFS transporter